MEPEVVRADPAHDVQPEIAVGRGSQKLVYLLLTAIGLILIAIGGFVRSILKEVWMPEVCIAGGIAIAAPGILSYLYRKYMLEEIKLEVQRPAEEFKRTAEEMIRGALANVTNEYGDQIKLLKSGKAAGLSGVYMSRPEAFQDFMRFLAQEKNEVLLVGSSFRGFLQEYNREFEDARKLLLSKKQEGVKLRFLLTHPIIADLRAKQESREAKAIGEEILDSIDELRDDWKIPREDIKLYLGTPTCFGIKTTEAMLLNTYPYMKEAFTSPCLICERPGYFYAHFDESHFHAWTSLTARPVPNSTDEMRSELDKYAGCIQELMDIVTRPRIVQRD